MRPQDGCAEAVDDITPEWALCIVIYGRASCEFQVHGGRVRSWRRCEKRPCFRQRRSIEPVSKGGGNCETHAGLVCALWHRGPCRRRLSFVGANSPGALGLQHRAEGGRLLRGARRSRRWLGRAEPRRSHGPARHGHDQPAAGRPGRAADHEEWRQRHRCRGHGCRRAQSGRADEHRPRRRPVRDHLRRQGKEDLHAQCQRHGAERRHARSFQFARLSLRCRQLGTGLGHAALWHPDGDGAGQRLGLGGGAQAVRQEDLQGDAAAGDRLRRERFPDLAAHRQ